MGLISFYELVGYLLPPSSKIPVSSSKTKNHHLPNFNHLLQLEAKKIKIIRMKRKRMMIGGNEAVQSLAEEITAAHWLLVEQMSSLTATSAGTLPSTATAATVGTNSRVQVGIDP